MVQVSPIEQEFAELTIVRHGDPDTRHGPCRFEVTDRPARDAKVRGGRRQIEEPWDDRSNGSPSHCASLIATIDAGIGSRCARGVPIIGTRQRFPRSPSFALERMIAMGLIVRHDHVAPELTMRGSPSASVGAVRAGDEGAGSPAEKLTISTFTF